MAPEDGTRPFSSAEFRSALGLFPTGVVVVTATTDQGEDLGATVSSFNSVSLDPPLVLWSVAKSSHAYDKWKRAQGFAVNILASDQQHLSQQFAAPLADKWRNVPKSRGINIDAPLISDALATLECRTYRQVEAGDHLVILGLVEALSTLRDTGRNALLFFRGEYSAVAV